MIIPAAVSCFYFGGSGILFFPQPVFRQDCVIIQVYISIAIKITRPSSFDLTIFYYGIAGEISSNRELVCSIIPEYAILCYVAYVTSCKYAGTFTAGIIAV